MKSTRPLAKRSLFLAASCLLFSAFPASLLSEDRTEEGAAQLAATYEFAFPGGLGSWRDSFSLVSPQTVTIRREFNFRESGPPRTCTYRVPECGQQDGVGTCDLEAVLLNEHVLELWPESGETVYGGDARHYDGAVFTIAAPERGYLTVGVLCRDEDAECLEEHQSLLGLREAFTELARQARSSPSCDNLSD